MFTQHTSHQPAREQKQEMSFDIIFIPFNMFYGNHLSLNFPLPFPSHTPSPSYASKKTKDGKPETWMR